MAGWTHIRGWGGNPVIRELLQFSDGRIGSKWMDEIIPETEPPSTLAASMVETMVLAAGSESFLLTFQVQPAAAHTGRLGISFLPEDGEHASCELQLRLHEHRAQFAPGSWKSFAGDRHPHG